MDKRIENATALILRKLTGMHASREYYEYYYNSMRETFMQKQYMWLAQKAKGKTVIDLGAQTGDSAIYFLQHGAKHVIAYEPDPYAFAMLEKNTKGKRVLSSRRKAPEPFEMLYEPYFLDILYKPFVIKCDIEGNEHQVFTGNADLHNCIALQIEYHHGPQRIPMILKSKGFKVKVSEPYDASGLGEVGWIYAWR